MKKTDEEVMSQGCECKNCQCGDCPCGKMRAHGCGAGKMYYHKRSAGASGGLYGLGFVGAVIYFISTATSFGMGAIGVLKALVWPAFLVYELMKMLNM